MWRGRRIAVATICLILLGISSDFVGTTAAGGTVRKATGSTSLRVAVDPREDPDGAKIVTCKLSSDRSKVVASGSFASPFPYSGGLISVGLFGGKNGGASIPHEPVTHKGARTWQVTLYLEGRWSPTLCLLGVSGPTTVSTQIHVGPHTKLKGFVYFRQVLCIAPPFVAPPKEVDLSINSCSAASALTPSNLAVSPNDSAQGYSANSVPADATLTNVPSTQPAQDHANATVLLPGLRADGTVRYLLGPAQMGTAQIANAYATETQGQWVVNYTMTRTGTKTWDRVAQEDFHRLMAIDLNGVVVSAPIIEPTQMVFSTFGGNGQISGNLTRSEAITLARTL